jgi:DNA polymerase-4
VPDFHVAVARRANPELADLPIIVGGDPAKRGRVVGCAPELRALGIAEGQGVAEALARAPSARWVRTDMQRAREVSGQLRAAIRREIGAVETSGLSAFYFRAPSAPGEARALGEHIVSLVLSETGLALRVGIAPARFAAVIVAQDVGRQGVGLLTLAEFDAFLAALAVERLPSVGPKTKSRLLELGVRTVAQLRSLGAERLELLLGTAGRSLWLVASGEDPKPLRVRRHPLTLSREERLEGGGTPVAIETAIAHLATRLEKALRRDGLSAGRIALRLTPVDARSLTRSRSLWPPATSAGEIAAAARDLLDRADAGSAAFLRVGIVLKGLELAGAEDRQLDLF